MQNSACGADLRWSPGRAVLTLERTVAGVARALDGGREAVGCPMPATGTTRFPQPQPGASGVERGAAAQPRRGRLTAEGELIVFRWLREALSVRGNVDVAG